MPGLHNSVIARLDSDLALHRIRTNIKSDFVYSPHMNVIYWRAGNELWEALKRRLSSGNYEPSLPIQIAVPKPSGLTRPGAILLPIDRLMYQLLADFMAPMIESNLDRTRVFSHEFLSPDPEHRMFRYLADSYGDFIEAIKGYCGEYGWAVKTDVASFFESIHHHPLINSLHAISCSREAVNILDKMLSAWRQRKSYGILQQSFPSDLFGNFYLFGVDYFLKVRNVSSVRFVDDLFMFVRSKKEGLKILDLLCDRLRKEGLILNDSKTSIKPTDQLIEEETELERMLLSIRTEIEQIPDMMETPYGFQIPWYLNEPDEVPEIDGSEEYIEELFKRRGEAEWQRDKIVKFCLPLLGRLQSDVAVGSSLEGIVEEPHLARIYCSYLSTFIRKDTSISDSLMKSVLHDAFSYDWQYMWTYASLLYAEALSPEFVEAVLRQLLTPELPESLRAVCAVLVGRHGSAAQKRQLQSHYESETSEYVRGALLFSAQFFPDQERKACYRAWRKLNALNYLIYLALKNLKVRN